MKSLVERDFFLRLRDGCRGLSAEVVRLNQAFFGLHQSRPVYNELLMQKLSGFGLERCAENPCIFRPMSPGKGGLV